MRYWEEDILTRLVQNHVDTSKSLSDAAFHLRYELRKIYTKFVFGFLFKLIFLSSDNFIVIHYTTSHFQHCNATSYDNRTVTSAITDSYVYLFAGANYTIERWAKYLHHLQKPLFESKICNGHCIKVEFGHPAISMVGQ